MIPKHTTSHLPWKLTKRRTSGTKTLVVGIVDANGDIVIGEVIDEYGSAYSYYKMIVEKVNGN